MQQNIPDNRTLHMPLQQFQRFLMLWVGELISTIGSGLTAFAVGVYLYRTTGRATDIALVTLCAFLPAMLLSPLAGVLADRYDRRVLMLVSDSLSAVGPLFLLVHYALGTLNLTWICIGMLLGSVCSSLIEPAYRATITDLLSEQQYARATSMMQLASAARYLVAPLVGGVLMSMAQLDVVLGIDICSFVVAIVMTWLVCWQPGRPTRVAPQQGTLRKDLAEGWHAIRQKRGVWNLVLLMSGITFCIGFLQTLLTPYVLSFTTETALGIAQAVSALGLLAGSAFLSMHSLQMCWSRVIALALVAAGICMALIGSSSQFGRVTLGGFLFFATLPFANTGADYLVRTAIENELQGRVWGLIGILSQVGYLVAYAISGVLADHVFTPLLERGALASRMGPLLGVGPGRGIGLLLIVMGLGLSSIASLIWTNRAIQALEV